MEQMVTALLTSDYPTAATKPLHRFAHDCSGKKEPIQVRADCGSAFPAPVAARWRRSRRRAATRSEGAPSLTLTCGVGARRCAGRAVRSCRRGLGRRWRVPGRRPGRRRGGFGRDARGGAGWSVTRVRFRWRGVQEAWHTRQLSRSTSKWGTSARPAVPLTGSFSC